MGRLNTIVLVFFITFFTFSQEKFVSVDFKLEYGIVKNEETLIANNKNAKYVNNRKLLNKTEDSIFENEENRTFEITQKNIILDKIETYKLIASDIVYQIQHKDNDEKVYLIDSLPQFKWNIIADDKINILGFQCTKATCNFRGTDIVAYFTEEIPISFGPWKFSNLPGLILEVYTEKTLLNYKWSATKITYPYNTKETLDFKIENLNTLITMKEYVVQKDNEIKEKNKLLDSRNPNGTKASSSKTIRLGVEKIYEWEKE
ncbi:GLPGLI family protein [Flavobacterium sp.]|uniref:GLPGLI family protein n=1 Tax=Flavobacterium sp. TaxID=239 RepID=UPI003F697FCD